MLAKLQQSALSSKDADRLGFIPLTRELLAQQYPELTQHPAAGFLIPYFTSSGTTNGFYRYRYLEEPPRTGFAALTAHKALRYIQPAGKPPHVYFPRSKEWSRVLPNPEHSLYITEGELKAACAVQKGIPAIGLGGVWNWKSTREELPLIDDLKNIAWTDRTVYIVFDSDATTNPDILRAQNALCRELLKLGADLHIIRLPELEPGKKTGLDDFLVAEGEEEFAKLQQEAESWSASAELHKLNDEVSLVFDPGYIIRLDTFQRMAPDVFCSTLYADRVIRTSELGKTKDGKIVERSTEKSAAREFLKWPYRSVVARVTYAPGRPRWTDGKELNTWQGWGLDEKVIKPGSTEIFTDLVAFLFDGATSTEDAKWFLQWLAYPLQHPGEKMFSAVVMWGLIHGTGKTLIGHTMQRIYGSNFAEISDRDLLGTFNEWAENKQFVMGDEITGGDRRAAADYMKGLITQKFLRINPKYIKPYVVPDCINYYFTSNHPDSFFLEDSDRRYFITEVKGRPLPERFYRQYDAWYRSDAVGALFYYLLNLDLKNFNPRAPAPATAAKANMIADGRSDVALWVSQLHEARENILKQGQVSLADRYLWTTEELFSLYDPERKGRVSINGFNRELRRAGFRRVLDDRLVRMPDGSKKLWVIADHPTANKVRTGLSNPAQVVALYLKERRNGKRNKY